VPASACLSGDGLGCGSSACQGQRQRAWARPCCATPLASSGNRGASLVGLVVDADNGGGRGLYEAAGMHCIQQYDEYQQPLLPAI